MDSAFRHLNTVNGNMMLGSVIGIVYFGLRHAFYAAAQLPYVITLFILSVAIAKGFSLYSQTIELQADRESVRLNGNAKALISAYEKITVMEKEWAQQHVTRRELPWAHLFADHPDLPSRKRALGLTDTIAEATAIIPGA